MKLAHYILRFKDGLCYGPFKTVVDAEKRALARHGGFAWTIVPVWRPLK